MTFNWCYFPLESNGLANGIQNPLPDFVTQNGDPWAAANNWFNGNGSSTSLITPWTTDSLLFDSVALPRSGGYLIGFQLDLDAAPVANETILSCGYNSSGNTDGLRIEYLTNGKVRFRLQNRNYITVVRDTKVSLSNSLTNIFCYVDHRPAGTGVDAVYVHAYTDATDIKSTSPPSTLRNIGEIYPQQIDSATALIVGAMQIDGSSLAGTYFSGRIRRLHMMNFGSLSDDVIANLAELMGELSKASMIPTAEIQLIAGFPVGVASRSFVEYV